MKRVLIYMDEKDLSPCGGPRGYLYNLNLGLMQIKDKEISIEFLKSKPIQNKSNNNLKTKIKKTIKKIIPKKLLNYRNNIYINKVVDDLLNGKSRLPENYNKYDYIHFHSCFDLYCEREKLKNYSGIVILNSHSPEPIHMEKMENDDFKKIKNKEIIKQKLEEADIFAFYNSDYIVFPCKEAEEPYYNKWSKYKKIHEENESKYLYMLTGTKQSVVKRSKSEIRKAYNIPEDALLISYVGRHNSIKGYDLLKEIGEEVLKEKEIYMIIAGKEGPLYSLNDKKWVEVGWTNDPHSIIAASDLFVLPNRETYFDLVFLEVLSIGIPMLVSLTGGNKYFKNYKESGILFFTSKDDAIKQILSFKGKTLEEKNKMGKKNIEIYNNDFSEHVFAQNYINLIKKI